MYSVGMISADIRTSRAKAASETMFQVQVVEGADGKSQYEFWDGDRDLWLMPVDDFHKYCRTPIAGGICVLNKQEEYRLKDIADVVLKRKARAQELKERPIHKPELTLSFEQVTLLPATMSTASGAAVLSAAPITNAVHQQIAELHAAFTTTARAGIDTIKERIPALTPEEKRNAKSAFAMTVRAATGLMTLSQSMTMIPLATPDAQVAQDSSVVSDDEAKPLTPQCFKTDINNDDIFKARMDLFRESGRMPQWVEKSAQATLDIARLHPEILSDAGFVSADHAHAQSLVTASIESVFNTRKSTPASSAQGTHHFFWDTAQDVLKAYPQIKKMLKDKKLDVTDPNIRNNEYASTLLYYGYSALTRRLFTHEANKYLDTLEKRKIIGHEHRAELLENALKNTVNYDRHVAGARGSAMLHIRMQITPDMKAEDVVGRRATKKNMSIFGHGHTVGDALEELRHRVDSGTQVHTYGFPYQSTVVHRLNNTFKANGSCQILRADVFGGYKLKKLG